MFLPGPGVDRCGAAMAMRTAPMRIGCGQGQLV